MKPSKDCQHESISEVGFANRADIKFKRCDDCGDREYPDGFVKINEGKTVTIVWPQ